MAEKKSTREGFGDALLELGKDDSRIVVLDADLAKSTQTVKFANAFPERFFDCGVAEQNLMGTAAGLAAAGKIAVVSTFAIFASGRAFEQVRNTIAYGELNVKVCPSHGGISVGEDGSSHQALEDIALMRAIPKMRVVVPADYNQARAAIRMAVATDGPFYIRMGRPNVGQIYGDDYVFELGKAAVLREGTDISILACGITLGETLEAAELLAADGISAEVLDLASIKPMDSESVLKSCEKTGRVLTVEDHSITGGLGGAVAELLAEKGSGCLYRVGIRDEFGVSGSVKELMEHYGLTAGGIARVAREMCGS